MSAQRPRRLLRVSKACDFCHKRRIKCQDNPAGGNRCQNCAEFDIPCTYARPSRRGRGSPPPPLGHYHRYSNTNSIKNNSSSSSIPSSSQQHQRTTSTDDTPIHGAHISAQADGHAGSSTDEGDSAAPEPLSPTWQAFAHTVTPALKRLFAIYHETVYPIFPFFDPIRLERRLDLLEHVRSRAFFCSVMAACALASARARDGALSTDGNSAAAATASTTGNTPGSQASSSSRSGGSACPTAVDLPAAVFLAAAEEALPRDILQCQDFDYLRGCALLAIASIQDAKIASMHKYIGLYFTLMAVNQWHDEANWPARLHATEVEERRRLYWSIYTLDVYSSIIWDGCIHFQESHARVDYPTGQSELPPPSQPLQSTQWTTAGLSPTSPSPVASTATVAAASASVSASASAMPNWMVGWNFTTDLYRVLEHNLSRLRSRASQFALSADGHNHSYGHGYGHGHDNNDDNDNSDDDAAKRRPSLTSRRLQTSSQDRVAAMYAKLPAVFKQLQPATGDPSRDVYGFQAANIQATLGLLQMVHLSLEADAAGLEQRCAVVQDVLQIFHRVPKSYLRAISTPFIYHIGGIGVILGSVMERPLSEASCRLIRELLLSMAALLESLEASLHRSAGAGQRLRNLVARLEAYVVSQRLNSGDPSSGFSGSSGPSGPSGPSGGHSGGPHAPVGITRHALPNMGGHATTTTTAASAAASASASAPVIASAPHSLPLPPLELRQQNLLPTLPTPAQAPAQLVPIPLAANAPLPSPVVANGPANVVSVPVNSPAAVYHHHQHHNNASPWAQSAAGNPLPPNLDHHFQLPDELLQDWTWPFVVSNSYLSF